jgi:hypothetical protein
MAATRIRASSDRLVSCEEVSVIARGQSRGARGHRLVEGGGVDGGVVGFAPHLVRGDQRHLAIEGRVLLRLGDHRARDLLEAEAQGLDMRAVAQEHVGEEGDRAGITHARDRGAGGVADHAAVLVRHWSAVM